MDKQGNAISGQLLILDQYACSVFGGEMICKQETAIYL
jgi:hypothetical protein